MIPETVAECIRALNFCKQMDITILARDDLWSEWKRATYLKK